MEEKDKPQCLQHDQKTVILTERMKALKSSIVHSTASIAEQVAKGTISASAHPILSNMVTEAKNLLALNFVTLPKNCQSHKLVKGI